MQIKRPGGAATPAGAVTTLTRLMRLQKDYNIFPLYSQDKEEIYGI